jgi:hypothetical protein
MFKVLASSPEDRWKAVSSDGTFKSYSRVISGAGLPMLRAEGVISGGWTVEQINAVIESSGCRQIWDERFDNLSIAETFNSNEYLFHVALRGIGSLTYVFRLSLSCNELKKTFVWTLLTHFFTLLIYPRE